MRLALIVALISTSTPAQTPAFEVVSVKPSANMQSDPRHLGCSGATFVASGQFVQSIIQWAYDVQPLQLQVSMRPAWLVDLHDTYVIEAKANGPLTEEDCKRMVQAVFEDRFKLKFHRETQETVVYALVIGKNSPKLRKLGPRGEPGSVVFNGVPARTGNGELVNGWSMQDLAHEISGLPSLDGRPVVDRTGLTGIYALKIDFQLFPTPQPDQERPDIRTAVDQQLGLRLESSKQALEMLVIDSIQRPSLN